MFSYFSGFLVRLNFGPTSTACTSIDDSNQNRFLLQDPSIQPATPACLASFILVYYFSMAASTWWMVAALTWCLAAKMQWAQEAITK